MISGFIVSVEVNGDLTVEGEDMLALSLRVAGDHFTVIFTSVSTDGGSVAVQINVTEVPSYSGLFGTTRVVFGLGTVDMGIITIMHSIMLAISLINYLRMTVTETGGDVELMYRDKESCILPWHIYCPAFEVCRDVNFKVEMAVVALLLITFAESTE